MKQLNFDIPTPFVSEPKPERRKPQRREKTETANQDSQLDLLLDAPLSPEPPAPKRLSRPEHTALRGKRTEQGRLLYRARCIP